MLVTALVLSACGGGGPAKVTSNGAKKAAQAGTNGLTAAQLAEAKRLIDPDNEPSVPTAAQIACVARVVVLNPTVDEIANDMAQVADKDLRQLVMTDYLQCAYNYVLNLYMRFAPAGLTKAQLACVRSKFTELTVARLSEVMVLDPDAGYTGPLTINACKTGQTTNPLQYGTLPGMGSGS